MLARNHVLSGAAVWLALAPAAGVDNPAALAAGAVFAGGAALGADLDHPKATAAQTWGPITRGLGYLAGRAAGGHRAGTHTLAAAAAAGPATWLALTVGSWPAVAVLALLLGLAAVAWEDLIPGSYERVWPINLAASIAAAAAVVHTGLPLDWLPLAVALGWLAHIAGDALTVGGVPLFGPWSWRRYNLTSLRTGDPWERHAARLLNLAVGIFGTLAAIVTT